MRLSQLGLTRYGKFTDHVIDFGPAVVGQADLHIVYGPNEAGKSTMTAAFLDLLFGIERSSRYGFLHPYPTMRVTATLDLAAGPASFARIKRPQNSLLGPDDQPVAETAVLAGLGGLDRSAYRAMFSLDDDTLEEGGESILASQGNIGELLFSATTGLAELSRTLVQLRQTADGFYRPRAHGTRLNQLKADLAGLKEERDRIDTLASKYATLTTARDAASALYDTAVTEQGQLQAQIEAVQRRLNILPSWALLRDIRRQLEPLAELPDAPNGWLAELPDLQRVEITLATQLADLAAEIGTAETLAGGIVVDHLASRAVGDLERLEGLRPRHVTAEFDLPLRRREQEASGPAIAALLVLLGQPDASEPAELILLPRPLAALREGIKARPAIDAELRTATLELREAERRCAEVRAELERASPPAIGGSDHAAGMSRLLSAMTIARASDHAVQQRLAERALANARAELQRKLAAVRPWIGEADALAALAVVGLERCELWHSAQARQEGDLARLDAELEGLVGRQTRLQAEIDAMRQMAGVVDEHAAAEIRGLREAAWAEHRRRLDQPSAERFDQVLRRDDVVMDARVRHQADLAKLHEMRTALASIQADSDRVRGLIEKAHDAKGATQAMLAESARAIGLDRPDTIVAAELKAWLLRRAEALTGWESVIAAERAKAAADADAAAARTALLPAMADAGVAFPSDAAWESLLAAAQAVLDRAGELRSLRQALVDRERDAAGRRIGLQDAEAAELAWVQAWQEACSACWLSQRERLPTPAEAGEILLVLGDLGPLLESRATLARRIADMAADQQEFESQTRSVARTLDLAGDAIPAMTLFAAIDQRVQAARQAAADLQRATAALGNARQRHESLARQMAIHQLRKAEMTGLFTVETLREVAEGLQQVARRAELTREVLRLEQEIVAALNAASIAEAQAGLANADRDALLAELSTQKLRLDGQMHRTRELYADWQSASHALEAVGGDDAVARIEERRRTVLLDLEEQALGYLRLRAGIAAADRALRLYRDRHRSSMMSRASDAFAVISRGAYSGLATQPGKDGDELIAVGSTSGAKMAAALSKGTRFQLYLALRAAGYHEFAASQPPVPFIADDIMETFDDFRAEETFRIFGDMARVGQVIYLTHHRHLCDIARQIVPGVRIHELPGA